jgi:crossover junction endodeoxyribonuclease RuvC
MTRLASGIISLGRGELSSRLAVIYSELSSLIATHEPDHLSLERNFMGKSVQSAFRIGEARGVVMAAAAEARVALSEYPPATIKKAVAGHGRAAKADVQAAVVRMFRLDTTPSVDEADALATAACHGLSAAYLDRVKSALAGERRGRRMRGPARRAGP